MSLFEMHAFSMYLQAFIRGFGAIRVKVKRIGLSTASFERN